MSSARRLVRAHGAGRRRRRLARRRGGSPLDARRLRLDELENGVVDEVPGRFAHRGGDHAARLINLVLARIEGIAVAAEAASGLDAEEVAEGELARTRLDATLGDEL